ncbi:MAG: hypothetical protein M3R61_18330, partial [Chloroflexota bacterium]|nr:hypothetical protein [Chloroflexota bacterium]
IIGPDGAVQQGPFAISQTTSGASQNYRPVIASDGTNFLVAWQRTIPYTRQLTQIDSTVAFQTELMTRLFDAAGTPLTNESMLPNDRIDLYTSNAGSIGFETTSILNSRRDRLNDLSLAWVGTRYRLSRQVVLGAAAGRADLRIDENGTIRLPGRLSWRDIDGNGAIIPSSFRLASSSAAFDDVSGQSLTYDPARDRMVLIFHDNSINRPVYGLLYDASRPLDFPIAGSQLAGNARNVEAVYNAASQGYILSWSDSTSGALRYQAFSADLQPLLQGPAPSYTWPVQVDAGLGGALACPAPQSAPLVDLRFEELPGATTFLDSSGRSNNATSSGASTPTAGALGAPGAALSDYAVQFDGVDDTASMTRTVQDDFTIAMWLKVPTSNTPQMLVDGGNPAANGFQIFLNNGALAFNVPGFNSQAAGRIDDGQWHFIVMNRTRATGRVEAYVDGNGVIGVPGTANLALNGVSDLRLGRSRANTMPLRGTLDQLQIFPVALTQATVQAIYTRTVQSYCVAAGVATAAASFPWTRLTLRQQDTRGGRITASNGLTLTIDSDLPTAAFTSVTNNDVVGAGQVIAGTASDPTSGIGLVEVSINNGAWQAANGANSWAFSLAGQSGAISLRVRATDLVGNVGNPSASINLTVDSVAPAVAINAPVGTLKPTQNAIGQWQVNLTGTTSDAASGIEPSATLVTLEQRSGVGVAQTQQAATLSGTTWNVTYQLDASLADPTGVYTVTTQTEDNIGNRATPATAILRLD